MIVLPWASASVAVVARRRSRRAIDRRGVVPDRRTRRSCHWSTRAATPCDAAWTSSCPTRSTSEASRHFGCCARLRRSMRAPSRDARTSRRSIYWSVAPRNFRMPFGRISATASSRHSVRLGPVIGRGSIDQRRCTVQRSADARVPRAVPAVRGIARSGAPPASGLRTCVFTHVALPRRDSPLRDGANDRWTVGRTGGHHAPVAIRLRHSAI